MSGLVVQDLVDNSHALFAATLHPSKGRVLDLEVGRVVAVYLVDEILLEEQRKAQMGDCPGKGTVRTAGGVIAVCCQTHEAIPVLEVAQLTGVDFIDNFAVIGNAIPAAPQPISGFCHEVNGGHFPLHGDSAIVCGLSSDRIQNASHNDIIISARPNHHSGVQVL